MNKLDSLTATFALLSSCCLEEKLWTPGQAEEVILFAEDGWSGLGWQATEEYGGGSEYSALAIVKLKSGKFGLLESNEDYTGHGCRCGSYTNVYDSLELLLDMGIVEHDRAEIRSLLNG